MQLNSSPSVNIIRDAEQDMYYLPTANAKEVYDRIAAQFKSGVHSFSIIGSYGTGKSAFLWAFAKHLNGEKEFFTPVNGQFNACKKFKFINIIGEADSLVDAFAKQFDVEAEPKAITTALKKEHKALEKEGICLVIIVDEFGKFLEYAAKKNPDKELYFVQQIAELANNPKRNILFLTSLHQNFDAYAVGLSNSQRKEWEKVKGRLKELAFNEPVEQLLNILSVYLQEKKLSPVKPPQLTKSFLHHIEKTGTFNLLTDLNQDFSKALYPFDVLSAMSLAKALQKYGQNERSLFHFLSTDEYSGLYDYDNKTNPFFNLNCVYDYLYYNYYTVLTSRYNPDYFQWTLMRNSLDSVEVRLGENIIDAQKIIKTIGLLNLFAPKAAKIDEKLITHYAEICLNVNNAKKILTQLTKLGIIRYQKYNERYKLFQGTDIDIDRLIEDKKKEIEPVEDIISSLKNVFNLNVVPAKAVTYKLGTPRFFKFKISIAPIKKFDDTDGAIDGFVNIIFNETTPIKSIKEITDEPILYGIYKNIKQIKELLHEIEVINKVIEDIEYDEIATQELRERYTYNVGALNEAINNELFGNTEKIKWYFEGQKLNLSSQRDFNKTLSHICEQLYYKAPKFRNELMNKNKVSSSIHTARKLYFQHLISKWNQPDIGFPKEKMPPEKTIFKTLLEKTGIRRTDDTTIKFARPTEATFEFLWQESLNFLESAKVGKRNISEFVDTLSQKPFKLKKGFIDFWIPTFLFIHREEFELYQNGVFIPNFSKEFTDLFPKDFKKYQIKTFNVEGVRLELFNRYRDLIQVSRTKKATNTSFKETVKPFIVFYKQLPTYTQKTTRLEPSTKALRKVIKEAKEMEKTFFEQLPTAFGTSVGELIESPEKLDDFVQNIQGSIRELRTAFSGLTDRVENAMLTELGLEGIAFKTYTKKIQQRYSTLKTHLLLPKQRNFHTRLNTLIDNREDWINNIVHSVAGKWLKDISDAEEVTVCDKLITTFRNLDDLIELSNAGFDESKNEAIKIQLTAYEENPVIKNVIISNKQQKEVAKLEQKITKLLPKDEKLNQAVLIKLLKKYLTND